MAARVRLNTNENPYPSPPELRAALGVELSRVVDQLHRYPDRDALALRGDLADYLARSTGLALRAANVWAANGSDEILQQLVQVFGGPGRIALGFEPSYSVHRLIATTEATGWVSVPRRTDFSLDIASALAALREHVPDITLVTSPNNPTGQAVDPADLVELLDAAPGMVVVDEAYAEFSDRPSAVTLLPDYGHKLVVTRTMSKAFAFAGGRLGYLAAPAVVDAVQLVRLPSHLSALTQAAARVALRHAGATLASVTLLRSERCRVAGALAALGYRVVPSDANFILFGTYGGADADATWRAFLDRGVLIRDVGIRAHLRVTIGTPAGNDRFLRAAEELTR